MSEDDFLAPAVRTLSVPHGERGFHHQTLLYAGEDGFLAGTLPFITDALAAEEPILVAVGAERIARLKEVLADDAGRVQFADMHVLGSNPARIIPAWRHFLDEHSPDGRSVRGVGEPIWAGRSEHELTECQRHESLLNVAFDEGQAWRLLCPYDVDALEDEVILAAQESHPFVAERRSLRRSDVYAGIDVASSVFEGRLPEPDHPHTELVFTCDQLGAVRSAVAGVAAGVLPAARAEDLVLAVNELASNSIYHGGGVGKLRVWQERETLLCEVSDRGRIGEPMVGRVKPTPQQWSGRGLWLVNQLCDLAQIRSDASGSVVRVHMQVAEAH